MDKGVFIMILTTVVDELTDTPKLEYLYGEYYEEMKKIAYVILRDIYLAEDAVQEVFIKIIIHFNELNFQDYNKTRNLLITITKNTAIDIYRKTRKAKTLPVREEILEDTKIFDAIEINNTFKTYFSKLPINYSTILRLKYIDDLSNTEIAHILEIREDNVRKRLERARKAFKKLYIKHDKRLHNY